MRIVLQRVSHASVRVASPVHQQEIGMGLVIFIGVAEDDTEEDVAWLSRKVAHMRIFSDVDGKMNMSILDLSGQALIISQFTLHALVRKGNRPSFIKAAPPDKARRLYEIFIDQMRGFGIECATGIFGAHMEIDLVNDGPVTITMDSKNPE